MEPRNSPAGDKLPLVLLVLDDESRAARLEPALQGEAYRIRIVSSLSLPLPAQEVEPDLGITWFPYSSPEALPEFENLIRAIQALGRSEPLPVLLIVDQDGAGWVEPCFRLGITDILMRPIHPLILRQRVRLLLKARQTESMIYQLKQRVENQERRRMINALDSALQTLRTDDPETGRPPAGIVKAPAPFRIRPDTLFDAEQHCLIFDQAGRIAARKVLLTVDQSSILLYMICHPYRALSNQEIAEAALGYGKLDEIQARGIVRPHILRLRRKLEELSDSPEIVQTVRGSGYIFSPD
jgi:DNA-binding response OmpR family regulator